MKKIIFFTKKRSFRCANPKYYFIISNEYLLKRIADFCSKNEIIILNSSLHDKIPSYIYIEADKKKYKEFYKFLKEDKDLEITVKSKFKDY